MISNIAKRSIRAQAVAVPRAVPSRAFVAVPARRNKSMTEQAQEHGQAAASSARDGAQKAKDTAYKMGDAISGNAEQLKEEAKRGMKGAAGDAAHAAKAYGRPEGKVVEALSDATHSSRQKDNTLVDQAKSAVKQVADGVRTMVGGGGGGGAGGSSGTGGSSHG